MYQSGTVKLERSPSVCGLKMGKYSWQEDACVWLEKYPLAYSTKLDVPLSTRSRGSVNDRFATLRSIGDVVEQKAANLADIDNFRLWNHFTDYNFRVKNVVSHLIPVVDADSVASLAKNLNIDFDFLLARLQFIRNTKHFLYFGGVHLNEDLSLDDYVVTRKVPRQLTYAGTRGGDITLYERQTIYRFINRTNRSYKVLDLAGELNKPVDRVKNCISSIADLIKEAERMMTEGVTLMWGEDTDLWMDYISKLTVESPHPANMLLSVSISDMVAKDRNASPMYTHFRLNLIRNLKKFLYIAGIHEDPPSDCNLPSRSDTQVCASASAGTSSLQPDPNKSNSVVDLQDSTSILNTVCAVLSDALDALEHQEQLRLAVYHAVDWVLTTIETNHLVEQSVAAAIADMIEAVVEVVSIEFMIPELALPVVIASDSAVHQAVAVDEVAVNNDTVALTSVNHAGGFVDGPTAISKLETTPAPNQLCSDTETTPTTQDNPAPIDIAITKNSLRSSEAKVAPRSELSSTLKLSSTTATSTAKPPVPIIFADEPLEVTAAGAGNPYTMREDRAMWQAWLANPCFSDASPVSVGAVLAKKLKRTSKGINRRVQKLLIVREEAEQAVRDGFTLLPGSTALQMWVAYCALSPPMQSANSVYIHPATVSELAETHGVADLYDTLQAVRAIKWFLDMSGIHGHTRMDTAPPCASAIYNQTKESTTSSTMGLSRKLDRCEDTLVGETAEMKTTSSLLPSVAESAPLAPLPTLLPLATPPTQATPDTINAPSTLYSIPLLPTTHFAFSLAHEGDIWCAYVKSQLPASNKSLSARLHKLTRKFSCTFAQIKDKLNELTNLHLGLTVQCHSNGRPFTAAEEAVIAAINAGSDNSTSTNHSTSAARLVEVATQLRCSVGAVAVRSRQLKTLRLLQEVSNHIHIAKKKPPALPLHALLHSSAPPPPTTSLFLQQRLPALPPAQPYPDTGPSPSNQRWNSTHHKSSLGKRQYTSTDDCNSNKITRPDSNLECNDDNNAKEDVEDLVAYFSTEGEASDG